MNKQEIFDKVSSHLLMQNTKALERDFGACVYLAESGMKCAIGCLIPDGDKAQTFRGGVSALLQSTLNEDGRLFKLFGIVDYDDEDFLRELQVIHDQEMTENWYEALSAHATRWKLYFRSERRPV